MTRKKMADDMGLPESTLRGWQLGIGLQASIIL